MIRLALSGTYSSGKTITSMALAHLTGLPRSQARTMRELMPLLAHGQTLESCTAAQLVRLVVMRHTERVVRENEFVAGDASFLSDGSSLQEWAYASLRVRVGIDPNRSAGSGRGRWVPPTAELKFYGDVLGELGEEFRRHVGRTYEAFVHLANELPMRPDGHRPVNDTFRTLADELVLETQRALGLPVVVVGGPLHRRLDVILSAFGLPPQMTVDEAVRRAEHEYALLEHHLEAVRAHGRTATLSQEITHV